MKNQAPRAQTTCGISSLTEPQQVVRGVNFVVGAALLSVGVTPASIGLAVTITQSGLAATNQLTTLRLDGEQLLSELKDVETGQRLFMASGGRSFLDSYIGARPRIAAMPGRVVAGSMAVDRDLATTSTPKGTTFVVDFPPAQEE